jgi:very-short-patch-repair endonuclease
LTKLYNVKKYKEFRKELRKSLTPAEAKLWSYLKCSQLDGRKFRRQHSIGNYILDFYCPSERLAIELDGEGHFNDDAVRYDNKRSLWLEKIGILVLRFENETIFQQYEYVINTIKSEFGWYEREHS